MANQTILLIDYEPRSIERFRQPLVEAGYTVEIATDGLTGIEAFHRLSPDMVLVEAMIPKKHGFEVCQELKRSPHGRRTPVLITTGVYKGRKYRTQALHIYGCDEYIEKPIAPEQLLAVVGKFFAPGAAPASHAAPEPRAAAVSEPAAIAVSEPPARPSAAISSTHETPAPSRPAPTKSNPSAIAKDFTEEEIMARLDAILPGHETPKAAAPIVEVAAPATSHDSIAAVALAPNIAEPESADPFAQMQAELTAELGSMATALALEPAPVFEPAQTPMPSDQLETPSVFEALPVPDIAPSADMPASREVPQESAPHNDVPAADAAGQLVNFDARRSRRKKGSSKKPAEAVAPTPAPPSRPSASAPPAPPVAPRSPETKPVADTLTLPAGSMAESDLVGTAPKKGVPAWVWAAVAVVALAAVYFFVLRGRSTATADTTPGAPAPVAPAPAAPPVVSPAPESAQTTNPAPAPATEAATSSANLVLNSVSVPERRVEPPAPPASTPPSAVAKSSASGGAKAATGDHVPATKPAPAKAAPLVTAATAEPVAAPSRLPSRTESERPALTAPETPAAPGGDESVTGVDALPDPSAQRVVASIAPGTLVSADELDTAPVSLSRKLPAYSLQARQMRVEGTVVMKVLVNERGTVDEVVLVNGVPGADVNDAAMSAAKTWTYRPGTKGGVPVKVWKIEQVAFKL